MARKSLRTDIPPHPAKPFGHHAVRLFEELVEHGPQRRRVNRSAEALYDNGLIFIREECRWSKVATLSATLDGWTEYDAHLTALESATAA